MATFYIDLVNGNDANAGTSWATAWLTPTNGATSARVAAGDSIRIAKTSDPVSIGNATWTSRSPVVTLATAQTATIDNCETAWTAANSGSVTRTTGSNKEGTYRMDITTASTTATNTRYAYRTLPATLNLSAYQQITFWVQLSTATTTTDRWVINLCSDTLGVTVVDSFLLPAVPVSNQWFPVTITKSGGGNLGNSIASIAVYTGTVSPGNSITIRLDNISASKTDNLNLSSLIGQSSNGYSKTLPWNGIQSIDGTTVRIDRLNNTAPAGTLGYYTEGTSPATVTTYVLKPLTPTNAPGTSDLTALYTLNTTGTATAYVDWSGGWNTTSNTQDGITWLDGRHSSYGTLFHNASTRNYNSFSRIGISRMAYLFYAANSSYILGNVEVFATNINRCFQNIGELNSLTGYTINSTNTGSLSTPNLYDFTMYNLAGISTFGVTDKVTKLSNVNSSNNAGRGLSLGGNIVLENVTSRYCTDVDGAVIIDGRSMSTNWKDLTITNNTGYGILITQNSDVTINKLTSSSNSSGTINSRGGRIVLNNLVSTESPLFTATASFQGHSGMFITNLNGSATDNRVFYQYSNIISQTTVRKSATGIAWQTNVTNTIIGVNNPVKLSVAKVACTGNKQVTVKAWVKLSHATDIGAKLVVRGGQLPGITNDVTATKSADTNWEELTVSFTPTIAGVAEIELQSYWLANIADESSYVDDVTITEAA